jgi:hypothetical protein
MGASADAAPPPLPQAVYTLLNGVTRAGASAAGWAVPMATDIAFAMGVFGFFKSRMPPGAQAFLLTLATVDDLGAIAVIAVLCVHALGARAHALSSLAHTRPHYARARWRSTGSLLQRSCPLVLHALCMFKC